MGVVPLQELNATLVTQNVLVFYATPFIFSVLKSLKSKDGKNLTVTFPDG